ncbi:MAG: penicillin acylase family protein [bacterium]|nr:penicillin acylase family protein [bacterium]
MRACNVLVLILMVIGVGAPAYGEVPPVQTTRDAQGIWHIEGGSTYDVFEAMGYAVATDRLWQLDFNRRQGRGRLSEVLGPSYLSTDVFLRTIGYSDEELTAEFEALSEDGQAAVQGYTDGINRRIAEIYADWNQMPYEFWVGSFAYFVMSDLGFNYLPAPFTVNDLLAWTAVFFRGFDPEALSTGQLDNSKLFQGWQKVYPNEFMAMFFDMRWLNDPSAQTMIPSRTETSIQLQAMSESVDVPALPGMGDAADRIRGRIDNYQQQMEDLGIRVKMGSYAWAISGDRTDTGNPMLYSGPQMGFDLPAIVTEGSIRGGGLEVSGMHVPGMPGIAVGRTPHHAWSAQVGHAHTTDYFMEAPQSVQFHRFETIKVAGADDVTIPVFRSSHGPIIEPIPFNPADPPEIIVSWAYANWGHEADAVDAMLDVARATSIEEFGAGVAKIGVSQHTCYVDRDGNIAYWMTGFDPIRAPGTNPLFPQIGDGTQEWTGEYRPLAHDSNPAQGYYGGWNNKASVDYMNAPQSAYYGPAHRAHVIEEYLSVNTDLTFEEVRDLALNIATTDSFGRGGNTWSFVEDAFKAAVANSPSDSQNAAIAMLDAWDGHFVAGGPPAWRFGDLRADAWVLQDAWIRNVLSITFEDEFYDLTDVGMDYDHQSKAVLFNVLIRALAGDDAAVPTNYDWFRDSLNEGKPTDPDEIIVLALDWVIADMGLGPYEVPRGTIDFGHRYLGGLLDPVLGTSFSKIHSIPFSSRSTYAHVVEMGENGPVRIESMFPLGTSGKLWFNGTFVPDFDPNFFTMAPAFDPFMPRPFPLFD